MRSALVPAFVTIFLSLAGCGAASDGPSDDSTSAGAAGGTSATGGAASAISGGASTAGSTSGGSSSTSSGGTSPSGGSTAPNGGTSSDAGSSSGGSGGTAPHVVVDCESAEVGVWEEITPPDVLADAEYIAQTGYGVNAFVIDGSNSANIVLGTDHRGIYRTTDCGASWVHVDTGENGAALDGGTQWAMAIDPVDPNVIYTVSGYGTMGLFKTTNAGVDWQQALSPEDAANFVYGGFTAQVRIDPTEHEHVVITPHFTCENGHSESCFLETQDGGASWTAIENVPGGGEGLRLIMVDHDTWFLGSGGLHRTSDAGQTWTQVTPADSYAYEVFHLASGKYYLPTAFGISVSDDGVSWNGIDGAPGAQVVTTGDGRVYAGVGGWCVYKHDESFNPIVSAPIDDTSTWTTDTNYSNHFGSGDLKYDADHHMLYTSNCNGGFWRVKTQ